MGFMSESTLTVGSTAYNLAGNVNSRGNYLKNTILNLVVSNASSVGRGIVDAHSKGPATTYKRFAKWAESSGYNNRVGNYYGQVFSSSNLSTAGFDYLVPPRAGYEKHAISFAVDTLNIHLLVTAFVFKNRPEKRGQVFNAVQEMEYRYLGLNPQNQVYVPTGRLIIQYGDGSSETYTPPFNLNDPNLYAYLYYEERPVTEPTTEDTGWIENGTQAPNHTGYVGTPVETSVIVDETKSTQVVVTYSDSRPGSDTTTTEDVSLNFVGSIAEYNKSEVIEPTQSVVGVNTDSTQNEESYYFVEFDSVETVAYENLPGGVVKTTTTTVVTPYLTRLWKYRRVVVTTRQEKWLPLEIAVYHRGSDSYGDSVLFNVTTESSKFYPVIPVRRFNQMVDSTNFAVQYEWNKKAARKAFSSRKKYDTVLKNLKTSPSIDDVDHGWMVFGVSLGTQQQDGITYLYEFFKNLADSTPISLDQYRNAAAFTAAWEAFVLLVQSSTNDETQVIERPTPPNAQQYTFGVSADQGVEDWRYNVNISGKGGSKDTGVGMHPLAGNKVGTCWKRLKGNVVIRVPTIVRESGDDNSNTIEYLSSTTPLIGFGKQLTAEVWEEYEFFDLVHVNTVHDGKSVTSLAYQAIADADPNSSFIIPLQESVFQETGLIRRTQLSLEATFLVLNYYDVQTIPWYATELFRIIVVIIIIVIAVNTGYVDGSTLGLLGSNAAVGATLGLVGTAAVVAGAVANAIAAAIVSALITRASTALFGETWGSIIGTIVSIAVVAGFSGEGNFSLVDSFTQFTSPTKLMKLSLSGLQTYASQMQAVATKTMAETAVLQADYARLSAEIEQRTNDLLSGSGIDPAMVAEAIRYASETPSQFFARTSMTGSDIAETSIRLVEDFPIAQLKLPNLD